MMSQRGFCAWRMDRVCRAMSLSLSFSFSPSSHSRPPPAHPPQAPRHAPLAPPAATQPPQVRARRSPCALPGPGSGADAVHSNFESYNIGVYHRRDCTFCRPPDLAGSASLSFRAPPAEGSIVLALADSDYLSSNPGPPFLTSNP